MVFTWFGIFWLFDHFRISDKSLLQHPTDFFAGCARRMCPQGVHAFVWLLVFLLFTQWRLLPNTFAAVLLSHFEWRGRHGYGTSLRYHQWLRRLVKNYLKKKFKCQWDLASWLLFRWRLFYKTGASFLNINLRVAPFTTTVLASENLGRLGAFADFDLWALANPPFTSWNWLASARKLFKKLAAGQLCLW